MSCARNYENVLNFVKVMPKILLVPFFSRTRCISVYAVSVDVLMHAVDFHKTAPS